MDALLKQCLGEVVGRGGGRASDDDYYCYCYCYSHYMSNCRSWRRSSLKHWTKSVFASFRGSNSSPSPILAAPYHAARAFKEGPLISSALQKPLQSAACLKQVREGLADQVRLGLQNSGLGIKGKI